MGDFSIGALIGANQSFDAPSSWTIPNGWTRLADECSLYPETGATNIHSSAVGLRMNINSSAAGENGIRYDYGTAAQATWFPDITTHVLALSVWGYTTENVPTTNAELIVLLSASVTTPKFPFATTPARRDIAYSSAISGANRPLLDLQVASQTNINLKLYVDDVLLRVDETTIYPTYDMAIGGGIKRQLYRTLGGDAYSYRTRRNFKFDLPLELLSTSHANLFNWWWRNDFNLLLTLDTSDAESSLICRLVNEAAPISHVDGAGRGTWKGNLELLCINDGRLALDEGPI